MGAAGWLGATRDYTPHVPGGLRDISIESLATDPVKVDPPLPNGVRLVGWELPGISHSWQIPTGGMVGGSTAWLEGLSLGV